MHESSLRRGRGNADTREEGWKHAVLKLGARGWSPRGAGVRVYDSEISREPKPGNRIDGD